MVAALAVANAASSVSYAMLGHRLGLGPFVQAQARVILVLVVVGCLGLGLAVGWAVAGTAMIVLGVSTDPLSTVWQLAAEAEVPPDRRAEMFSLLFAAHNVGFALSGVLLAVLPAAAAPIAGGASGR